MDRNSSRSVWRAISASAPAISTPVGPPPTITNVSSRRRSSGSGVRSATSKASSMRRRISVASSRLFSPGANFSQSGLAEVRVRRARGDDEVVVRASIASSSIDGARRDVDATRLGQEHTGVLLVPKDPADGSGDVAG